MSAPLQGNQASGDRSVYLWLRPPALQLLPPLGQQTPLQAAQLLLLQAGGAPTRTDSSSQKSAASSPRASGALALSLDPAGGRGAPGLVSPPAPPTPPTPPAPPAPPTARALFRRSISCRRSAALRVRGRENKVEQV
ncbi:hypothetical protein EYF80_048463 [Liparis tanakae]|uniref:Uncharacterized protein n=1 Tax=Liparis tanakae TaxID=230148 RepID=A0A4Z2FKT6_9TELE|nr:hypothetical protein EYF80_048463 [Liparis tanakae]